MAKAKIRAATETELQNEYDDLPRCIATKHTPLLAHTAIGEFRMYAKRVLTCTPEEKDKIVRKKIEEALDFIASHREAQNADPQIVMWRKALAEVFFS